MLVSETVDSSTELLYQVTNLCKYDGSTYTVLAPTCSGNGASCTANADCEPSNGHCVTEKEQCEAKTTPSGANTGCYDPYKTRDTPGVPKGGANVCFDPAPSRNDVLSVVPCSGIVTVNKHMDYEELSAKSPFSLDVTVWSNPTDKTNDEGGKRTSSSATITVTLVDINEAPVLYGGAIGNCEAASDGAAHVPAFDDGCSYVVPEESAANTALKRSDSGNVGTPFSEIAKKALGTCAAKMPCYTDEDGGAAGLCSFSIDNGDSGNFFGMNSNNGQITVQNAGGTSSHLLHPTCASPFFVPLSSS